MMKKLILVFAALFSLFVIASAIANEDFYFYIHYDEQVSEGAAADVYYRVSNVGEHSVDDLSVKAYLPELDIFGYSPNFDISRDDSYSGFMFLDFPSDVKPGEYLIRFTASNDDERKVSHRYIIVD
jgi:hypothetical protein